MGESQFGAGDQASRLPGAYLRPGTSSFLDFLAQTAPEALPGASVGEAPMIAGDFAPHGTTIVALTFPGGVLMAGDRRATRGNMISSRDVVKVFATDEYSCIGIAGTVGLAIEMVRLFQLELEHYEKIEGTTLSMQGKANRLATLIRGNLGMALQGLAVVPLFAGYDLEAGVGRLFSYDAVGGASEDASFQAEGSGSIFAKGSLKKLYRPDLDVRSATLVALQALYDAADDDSATGGPDLSRRIFPIVQVITAEGGRRLPAEEVAALAEEVVSGRFLRPDGPPADVERPGPLSGAEEAGSPAEPTTPGTEIGEEDAR